MGGYTTIEIEIDENPLFEGSSDTITSPVSEKTQIPDWIKNNAGWWAEGAIDDDSFVQGIQFLIKEGILIIPS